MYKGASQTLQRRAARIEQARPDASTYVCEVDLVQSAANLGKAECLEERRQLLTEKSRLENEMVAAKSTGSRKAQVAIGHRIQNICSRLAMLRGRLHEIDRASQLEAFSTAVKEIVPPDMLQRIYARTAELKGDA